jgi:hypothetical protein
MQWTGTQIEILDGAYKSVLEDRTRPWQPLLAQVGTIVADVSGQLLYLRQLGQVTLIVVISLAFDELHKSL